ncbi:MAG TPA: cytidine deaminase [Synergistaceae bacterium]|nr:cytidine deaminase [Synergistaceae bacterium]
MNTDRLLAAARDAVRHCRCPYSGFRVTAVLESEDGRLFPGVNIENASFGLTLCAERAAAARAISSGATGFVRMLVYSPDGTPMPCGACRQFLAEFCREDFQVLVAGRDDPPRAYRLGELLPHAFTLAPERTPPRAPEIH